MNRRTLVRACATPVVTIPLVMACGVMVSRVGDDARFVTWPVVGLTALAAAVAVVGVIAGVTSPMQLAAGILPALVISYFLPAVPLPVIALVLLALAGFAVAVRGAVAGVAAGTGALMVLFVVLQGPAVECHDTGMSAGGPWWIDEPRSSSSSARAEIGRTVGVAQVGEHHYRYLCEGSRLATWHRTTSAPRISEVEPVLPNP